jgi:hypothetical protein
MPVYTLQLDDGRVAKIEGPANASTEDLGAALVEWQKAQPNPALEGMSRLDKFMAGAGKGVSDTGVGLQQAGAFFTGNTDRQKELRQEVEETRRRDAPLLDSGWGLAGNVAGNIGMALLPGGAALQTGKLLTKIPGAAKMAEALMTGGRALVAPKTLPGAAAVAAGQGAVQPSTSLSETALNTGIGAVGGAAVPAAVRTAQVGKALIEPLSEKGQQAIMGRTLQKAAGSPADAQALAQRLQQANQPFVGPAPFGVPQRQTMGEIVPGSAPTTGQLAADVAPSISALERTASVTDPTAVNAMARRLAEQNQARRGAVEGVAGTSGERDFLAANRDAAAQQLYGQARQQGIDPSAVSPEALQALRSRIPESILAEAKELARIEGVPLTDAGSVQGMHWVKRAVDSKISEAKRAGNTDMSKALTGLQSDLLDQLDQLSPAYGEARRTYSAMSKPINSMDVAQEVLNRGSSAATEQLRPEAFARALSDKTAATVTGRPGATLEGVMNPQGLNTLERVSEDLARAQGAQTAGRGVGSDTMQKMAYSNLMDQSGLPSAVQGLAGRTGIGGLAQRFGNIAYKDANQEMSQKLAEALLDPAKAQQLLEAGMVTPAMLKLVEGTRRGGGVIGAQAAPYLLNGVFPGAIPRVDVNLDLLNSEGRR